MLKRSLLIIVALMFAGLPTVQAQEAPLATPEKQLEVDWLSSDRESDLPEITAQVVTDEIVGVIDMAGLTWTDGDAGRVWLQTRDDSGAWTSWTEITSEEDHAPDDLSGIGGSQIAWLGPTTGVRFAAESEPQGAEAFLLNTSAPEQLSAETEALAAGNAPNAPVPPYIAYRTTASFVQNRSVWDTTDCRRNGENADYSTAQALVVHHTADGNGYSQASVPGIISGICSFHVNGRGWTDIGYNFLVDSYGTVWEGRTQSKSAPVSAAHTFGLNSQTQGVALIGDFGGQNITTAQRNGLRSILQWLANVNSVHPTQDVTLVAASTGLGLTEGQLITVPGISGHRDLNSTSCPGGAFYASLPSLRSQIVFTGGDDIAIQGYFNGDAKDDYSLFRPRDGTWWVRSGSNKAVVRYGNAWGQNGDVPVPGDYNGDGIDDLAVYRPATGTWWVRSGANLDILLYGLHWGENGDVPVRGDFNSDNVDDLALFRPSDGTWWVRSGTGGPVIHYGVGWGQSGDTPVSGDFNGDGVTDLALFRASNGTWWIRSGSNLATIHYGLGWGQYGDIPRSADYNLDGRDDLAIYRPSTGGWWIRSGAGSGNIVAGARWGNWGDRPITVNLIGDGRAELVVFRPSNGTWWSYDVSAGSIHDYGFNWGFSAGSP